MDAMRRGPPMPNCWRTSVIILEHYVPFLDRLRMLSTSVGRKTAPYGDLVEFDGLWGEESTCLKQFYVQHKVDVYANGAVLLSPGF
jgi:hypothetical protein